MIADDHRMLLDGLAEALDGLPDIEVIATAENGRQLLEALEHVTPDVLLVDIEMPMVSGIQALRKLPTPIPSVIVTMHTGSDERARAAAAGAVGFLSKSAPLPDLAAAVRAAAGGEVFMDGDQAVLDRHREAVLDEHAEQLTARERELLGLLAAGISSSEDLAEQMFISQKTVKNHLASIYDKLGITDRAQAAVEAIRLGFRRQSPPD
ncbi:MAG: response regulator transcription factor [Acidimicrobiia bacterium]|nr:response regulator transcription factor [Acidimicrobiia bacterium]